MSDYAFYDAWLGTDKPTTARDRVNANFGQARQRTWLAIDDTDSPYTVADNVDYLDCDATSGAITVNLKASPATGDEYVIRKLDSSGNAITIDGGAADINGAGTASLSSQYGTARLSYNGSEWVLL